jgi:hypothetical protein
MDKELIIECIALLNTANFQETLNDKRDEVVNKLKEQLRIASVSNTLIDVHNYTAEINGRCDICKKPEGMH